MHYRFCRGRHKFFVISSRFPDRADACSSTSYTIMENQQTMLEDEEKMHILSDNQTTKRTDKDETLDDSGRSTLPLASFNYINSIVGSGIIGMAYALNQAGILLGLALIIVLGIVTDYSLVILIKASRISGTHSYQGVMNAAFGTAGYALLTVLQFIYPFIAMISYNVLVGDTLTKVLTYYANLPESNPWTRRELIIALSTICFSLPLSLHDGMAKFARVSFISLVATLFVLCTIIIRLFTLGPVVPRSEDAWVLAKPGVTQTVAIASFAYMCHHSTFLLYGSLREPTMEGWSRLTHAAVFVSALFEIFFGLFGYATFTGFVQGDLLENYCRGDHLMNVARVIFCLTILLTSPIECFVARDIIINTLVERRGYRDHEPTAGMNRQRVLVTTAIVVSASLISFTTDCLSIVLEFNGVLAAIPLAYILPAVAYLKLEKQSSWRSRQKLPCIFMALFGLAIALVGIIMIFVNWGVNSSCSHGVEMSYCSTPVKFNTSNGK